MVTQIGPFRFQPALTSRPPGLTAFLATHDVATAVGGTEAILAAFGVSGGLPTDDRDMLRTLDWMTHPDERVALRLLGDVEWPGRLPWLRLLRVLALGRAEREASGVLWTPLHEHLARDYAWPTDRDWVQVHAELSVVPPALRDHLLPAHPIRRPPDIAATLAPWIASDLTPEQLVTLLDAVHAPAIITALLRGARGLTPSVVERVLALDPGHGSTLGANPCLSPSVVATLADFGAARLRLSRVDGHVVGGETIRSLVLGGYTLPPACLASLVTFAEETVTTPMRDTGTLLPQLECVLLGCGGQLTGAQVVRVVAPFALYVDQWLDVLESPAADASVWRHAAHTSRHALVHMALAMHPAACLDVEVRAALLREGSGEVCRALIPTGNGDDVIPLLRNAAALGLAALAHEYALPDSPLRARLTPEVLGALLTDTVGPIRVWAIAALATAPTTHAIDATEATAAIQTPAHAPPPTDTAPTASTALTPALRAAVNRARSRDAIEALVTGRSSAELRAIVSALPLEDAVVRHWVELARPAVGVHALHHPALAGAALDQFVGQMFQHLRYDRESHAAVVAGFVHLHAERRLGANELRRLLRVAEQEGLLGDIAGPAAREAVASMPGVLDATMVAHYAAMRTHTLSEMHALVRHPRAGATAWVTLAQCHEWKEQIAVTLVAHPPARRDPTTLGRLIADSQAHWGPLLVAGAPGEIGRMIALMVQANPGCAPAIVRPALDALAARGGGLPASCLADVCVDADARVRVAALCLVEHPVFAAPAPTSIPTGPSRAR